MNPATRSASGESAGIARAELDVARVRHLGCVLVAGRAGPVDLLAQAREALLQAQAEDVLRRELLVAAQQPQRPRPPHLSKPLKPGLLAARKHLPPPPCQRQQRLTRNNGVRPQRCVATRDEPAAARTRLEQGRDLGLDAGAPQPEGIRAVERQPDEPHLEGARRHVVGRPARLAPPGVGRHAGTDAPTNSATATPNEYGASIIGMWPTPGRTSSSPARASASAGPFSQPLRSCSPQMTSERVFTRSIRAGKSRDWSAGRTPGTIGAALAAPRRRRRAAGTSRPSVRDMPTNQPNTSLRGRRRLAAGFSHSRSVAAIAR